MRRIIDEAPRLAGEMASFLEWFNAPLAIDPVIKAGVAHFRFVTIHPNLGRAERCLNLFSDSKDRVLDLIGRSLMNDEPKADYAARFRERSKAIADCCGSGVVRSVVRSDTFRGKALSK
jgi:hypothetical protein